VDDDYETGGADIRVGVCNLLRAMLPDNGECVGVRVLGVLQ